MLMAASIYLGHEQPILPDPMCVTRFSPCNPRRNITIR